jgi:hypothetical protein
MRIETACDFDGTLTDQMEGYEDCCEGYKGDVGESVGIPSFEWNRIWDFVRAEILQNPEVHGRKDPNMGLIVAPATTDPIALTRATAEKTLITLADSPRSLGFDMSEGVRKRLPQNSQEIFDLLKRILGKNFPSLRTVFRSGAAELINELSDLGGFTIITDSDEKVVRRKLEILRGQGVGIPDVDIVGLAGKFMLDRGWQYDGLPEEIDCSPHLKRRVYTQRKRYYESLERTGIFGADKKTVIGDIWELDLMLAFLLGLKGVLITKEMTPNHEMEIVRSYVENGVARIEAGLEGVLAAVKDLHGC